MKNLKLIFIAIFTFLVSVFSVYAAGSATLSVSSSKIENGKSVTATVTLKNTAAWNVSINSSGATNGCSQKFVGDSGTGNNVTKTLSVTCKSSSTGIINFVMSGDITSSDGTNTKISGSKSVSVVTPRAKSKNNNLKSLSVEGYEISPEFSSSVNEYTVSVPSTVEKITINAKKEDSYASLTGSGEQTVEEGINVFEIIVTSETGVSNTYKLTVNVEDQNPINVKVNGKQYTVVKVAKNLIKPDLFEETTIKIGEYDIPAFVNEVSGYILVGLKDINGVVELFVYQDNKYIKYNEFISDKLSIVFLEIDKIPTNYKKTKINVNEEEIIAYKNESNGSIIIYGINLSNGKKNFYTYDKSEKTLQKFDLDNYENELKNSKNTTYLFYCLSGSLLFTLILMILFMIKSSKLKKILSLKIADENKKKVLDEEKEKISKNKKKGVK